MARVFLVALALIAATPAAAQQTPAPADDDLARAWHMLAADWRPFDMRAADPAAAYASACAGAVEEMAQVDAALPADLTHTGLAAIRAPHGLIIIPVDQDPHAAYVFPNADLTFITGGLAAVRIADAEHAVVGVTDAGGREFQLQLGVADGKAMMRLGQPDGPAVYYVGCASTAG